MTFPRDGERPGPAWPPIRHVTLGKANPERPNGVNVVVHNLALAGRRAGADVEVWGLTHDTTNNSLPRAYPLRLFRRSRLRFALGRELRAAIAASSPDTVFHMHGVMNPEFYGVARALAAAGRRWIVSPHGAYNAASLRHRQRRKRVFIRLFDRFLVGRAAAIHLLAEDEADGVRAWIPLPRAILLPNGQDVPDTGTRADPGNVAPVFGYVGRLAARQKGLDLLLEGFAAYRAAGGTGMLSIVGGGSEQADLEALAKRLDLGTAVRFAGARFGDEKVALVAGMDWFVHTSRWDGIPMAALEAAATGCPLLVTPATNIAADVTRWQAGLALTDNSPEVIAAGLAEAERLHGAGTTGTMGANAQAMIREDFSWDTIVRRFAGELQGLS